MTVLAEALINARLDADGQVADLHFGIIDWPYNDLTPTQALVVEKSLTTYDEGNPAALLVLMDDGESMMEVAFQANEKIKKFLSSELRRRDTVILTRFPSMSSPLNVGQGAKSVTHFEVPCRVYATTEEATASLADVAI